MMYDGVDVLNGKIKLPRSMPCINQDFAVVDWSRDRGIFDVGRGTDLESAIAICRLHAGHDDFMYFEHGVTIALIMGGDSNP